LDFLVKLGEAGAGAGFELREPKLPRHSVPNPPQPTEKVPTTVQSTAPSGRAITYRVFGESRSARNANEALVDILRAISSRDPKRLLAFAEAAQTRSRNHIGRTPEEIYPKRPDLARAEVFHGDWLVGLNISNREKARLVRVAAEIWELTVGREIEITFPNQDI
jgi:hypothetical protein